MKKKMDLAIGGQALIEGVMIRAPHCIVMSVRRPDGVIETKERHYVPLSKRHAFLNIPIIRGILNFAEMLAIGMKALNWSASKAYEEEDTSKKSSDVGEWLMMTVTILLSLTFALFLFKYIPFLVTNFVNTRSEFVANHWIVFNIIDGFLKIGMFLLYILVISRSKDIRRVFEYHGAEHKSIFAYEHGAEMTPDGVRGYQKEHPRCGTSFILIVFALSILVYTLTPRIEEFWPNLGLRIALLPFIAGIAYEILKLAGKYHDAAFMKIISLPGIWFQYLTTQEPDTKQLEVALATLKRALAIEEKLNHESEDATTTR